MRDEAKVVYSISEKIDVYMEIQGKHFRRFVLS